MVRPKPPGRLAELSYGDMDAAQRRVHDAIAAGPRRHLGKGVSALFMPWLRSPEMAEHAQNLGAFVRLGGSPEARLTELAILVTARFWGCAFEWVGHADAARRAGLGMDVIEALRTRRRPAFAAADEAAVYALATELHETHAVADATYAEAVARLGERGVVEIIGVLGYYGLAAMTLNAFRVPLADGAEAPFDD
jgi:4-carboxymuconolactone decarboxylase